MKQQELIQYIRAYTQLVPAELVADMDAPAPAIDMDDCYIALKGKPERETLLALVKGNIWLARATVFHFDTKESQALTRFSGHYRLESLTNARV